jgi:hypothetical protein
MAVIHSAPHPATMLRLTDTLPARVVYSEAQAALKPLMAHIQMFEQLEQFKNTLCRVQ